MENPGKSGPPSGVRARNGHRYGTNVKTEWLFLSSVDPIAHCRGVLRVGIVIGLGCAAPLLPLWPVMKLLLNKKVGTLNEKPVMLSRSGREFDLWGWPNIQVG